MRKKLQKNDKLYVLLYSQHFEKQWISLLLQTSQNDMSFKNTDMEITQKNAHKKDSWHSYDIRRSVAHNYNKNLCEKNYEKKKKFDKNKYRCNCNCKISQNDKYILLQDMHYAIQYTTLSITYFGICTTRMWYNILHCQLK